MIDWGLQDISPEESLWGQNDVSIPSIPKWGEEDIPSEKTGFFGALIERPFEKIPFSPAGVVRTLKTMESAKRLQSFNYATTDEKVAKKYPEMKSYHRKDIIRNAKELQARDIEIVEDYLLTAQKEYTLAGRVGQILSEMPSYMIEFLLTGGLHALGKKSAKKVGAGLLGRYAKTTAGKAALATGGFAIGAAARSAGMPHRAAEAILQRQVPQNVEIDDEGNIDITGPVESPATAVWKGLLDHYIEIASEQAGEFLAPSMGKYFKKLPFMGKFLPRLQKAWTSKTGKSAAVFYKTIQSKTGFHGVLGEVGEEYLGDITRAITTVDDFGAGEDANTIQRISAGVKQDTENLPAMLIAFSIPGTAMRAATIKRSKQVSKDLKAKDAALDIFIESTKTMAKKEQDKMYEGDLYAEEYSEPVFKKPGAGIYLGLTPKWLVNRVLGVESLLQDVDAASMSNSLEQTHINSWISKIEHTTKKLKSLRKIPELLPTLQIEEDIINQKSIAQSELDKVFFGYAEEVPEERTVKNLRQKITKNKPLYLMRDLLDTYEEAPDFLTKEEQNVFNQVRELTRYLRQRANLVRERMGLEPIQEVKGYITHWMDKTAEQVVKQDLPIHSGYLYWLMKGLPKEIKNPTAMKRKVHGMMEKYFSKDLGRLLRVMTTYDLRDIHLLHPYQAAWDELQRLRKERLIPESTYNQIEKYLRFDIRKHKSLMDKAINITLKKPVDFVSKFLPASRQITDPSRFIFGNLRRFGHLSGLGFRLKPPIRNLGQRLLLLDLYRVQDYTKAQAVALRLAEMPTIKHPVTGEDVRVLDLVREQDWYQISLRKFEDIYSAITGVEKAAMYIYGKTHVGSQFLSNVETAALTGYFDWQNNFEKSQNKKSEHYKNCLIKSRKLGVPLEELLTQESDMMWNIREAVRRTQWEYMSISMPSFFRGDFNRAAGMFSSWWMNYFFNHCRECTNQIVTGRNSKGRLLTPYARLRAFKGMGTVVTIGRVTETILGIEMLKYLFMPVPGYLPPIPELIAGIIQYFAADTENERKKAAARVQYGLKFWVPFSAFLRDANRLLSGEYDLSDFLFYKSKPE